MSDEEVREFLMRWLVEFGTEPVSWEKRTNSWYMVQAVGVLNPQCARYFTSMDKGCDKYQLNQKGLDFIKGE